MEARIEIGAIATALYWDTEDPYHYVRLQRTSNRELGGDNDEPVDILIVGGEDHKAGQAQDVLTRDEWKRRRLLRAKAGPLADAPP